MPFRKWQIHACDDWMGAGECSEKKNMDRGTALNQFGILQNQGFVFESHLLKGEEHTISTKTLELTQDFIKKQQENQESI